MSYFEQLIFNTSINKSINGANKMRQPRSLALLIPHPLRALLLCPLLTMQLACSTVYLHDFAGSSNLMTYEEAHLGVEPHAPLPYKQTQHDGLVMVFSEDNSIDVNATCGASGWKTIKIESNFTDLVIRAIANPIWGTFTIEYICNESAVAHIAPVTTHSPLLP